MTSTDDPLINLLRHREHMLLPLAEFERLTCSLIHDDVEREAMISTAKRYRGPGDLVLRYTNAHVHEAVNGTMTSRREMQAHLISVDEALSNDAAEIRARGATYWPGIPNSVKTLRNWGFWTERKATFSVEGALGKEVRERKGYGQNCKLDEPETWNTFAELEAALSKSVTSLVAGPTFALHRDAFVIVFDIDPPERNIPSNISKDRHDWYLEGAQRTIDVLLKWARERGAFIETSRSGQGTHIFIRCVTPPELSDKYAIGYFKGIATIAGVDTQITSDGKAPSLGGFGHILLGNQHVFMTGRKQDGSGDDVPEVPFEDFNELLQFLLKNNACAPVADTTTYSGKGSIDLIDTCGRRIDLTDEQVVAGLPKVNKSSAAALSSPYTHGDFSEIIRNVTGDLDKVTGDPAQLLRVIMRSQLMRTAGSDKNGRNRQEKFLKFFWRAYLPKCRERNNVLFASRAAARVEQARLGQYFGWSCELKRMPSGAMALLPIYNGDRAEFIFNAYASKYNSNMTPAPTTATLLAWREAPAPDWLAAKINELLSDTAKFLALYNDYYEGPLP